MCALRPIRSSVRKRRQSSFGKEHNAKLKPHRTLDALRCSQINLLWIFAALNNLDNLWFYAPVVAASIPATAWRWWLMCESVGASDSPSSSAQVYI